MPLLAPKTFLKPTSVERFADRAVDKLIKFIQAIIKINISIYIKILRGMTFKIQANEPQKTNQRAINDLTMI